MGVDLGLEHLQFRAPLLRLLLDDVVHQVVHGGHHGPDGSAQVLHLIAPPLLDLHVVPAGLQLLDGLLQTADGVRDMGGDPEIQKGHQEDGEQQQRQSKQDHLVGVRLQILHRHHTHQLPAGVAHGLNSHLPLPPLKALPVAPVGVARRRPVVLLQQAGVDQLLPRVIDQLAGAVDEIEVTAVGQLYIPADLLDAAEAHVHQQHPRLGGPAPGKLHLTAQGDHPPVAGVLLLEQVLDVWGGEVEILHLFDGNLEPAAVPKLRIRLQLGQGRGGDQPALLVKHGDGHDGLPVLLVQKTHAGLQGALLQIGVLDDPVIQGVGHPHHPPQIAVQVHVHLGQDPLAVVLHQLVCGGGEAQEQAHAHKYHAHNSHRGEGEGDHHLDPHGPIAAHRTPCHLTQQFSHTRPPS